MKNIKMFLAGLLFPLMGIAQPGMADCLETYPAPAGVEMKQDFEVKVRVPGGEWQPVPTYAVKVDRVADARHHVDKRMYQNTLHLLCASQQMRCNQVSD